MSSIPEEIYFEIFLKVPEVQSLLACKYVCKTWIYIISNLDFVKKQLNLTIKRNNPNLMLQVSENYTPTFRNEYYSEKCLPSCRNVFYSIRHDSLESLLSPDKFFHDYALELDCPLKSLSYTVEVMGCCNGLVCLWFWKKQLFCLWNPATREYYKVLPKSNIHDDDVKLVMVAPGYDDRINDYKLFVCSDSVSEVYLLGLNSWRSIENVTRNEFLVGHESGILLNRKLHWLGRSPHNSSSALVYLDISNEIFKEMDLPAEVSEFDLFFNLGVLEGCLRLLSTSDLDDHVKIWVMQNYGVWKSWTNRYIVKNKRIVDDTSLRLLWSFKSGEDLFRGDQAGLLLYDPKYGSPRLYEM
ncbi:F-box/kelch-repeat protein At3g06240-like [Papaver somniferum]|uniref:F-box/kelch-repeat protein At3g06240-like n=1 Tax=Papaver somniferum TaxID=3469 RepID=UPI000E6FBD4C|nr:F-box/kelch-repeat protein At3g06240-like [Papaver somniferum]